MPPTKIVPCRHCGVKHESIGYGEKSGYCGACATPALFDSVCNFCGREARIFTGCFQVEIAMDLALDKMKATPYKRDGAL